METVRLTVAEALVKYLAAQKIEVDGTGVHKIRLNLANKKSSIFDPKITNTTYFACLYTKHQIPRN